MDNQLYSITIGHQLGSGGAYVGQKLSERLEIPLIDRQILIKVAEKLHVAESYVEGREEKLSSFWRTFAGLAALMDPEKCLSADQYYPTDQELFQHESETMLQIAEKSSAIFIGRCGQYILRDHPRHFSLLVTADIPHRIQRVRQLFCLSETEAKKLIQNNDKERAAYIRTLTHQDWLDPRLYDLCVNTSTVGLDETVELAIRVVRAKIC